MRRLLIVVAIGLAPARVGASTPRSSLRHEVCEAERRPAITSLAIPEAVRESSRRVELIESRRRLRRARRARVTGWVLVATMVAAASAIAMVESR